ncbi:adenosylcobinamide-GDP ribazoletransferase [Mangrovicella endophytica]|uniref:adenosylcobinamide-GDP ribazoletransferase n=1 Tax=Mangrovicella endophytica TaxID=2066697 RepID=UPI000C9DA795|nr:adenosylcobinamide-GDP ribazoletransferase [Mangrovicella endophytica]
MIDIAAATLRSLAFLTRLPPVGRAFTGNHPLGDDAHAFPIAGLIAALPAAITVAAVAAVGLSPLVAATLSIAVLVLTTGALHEDGLGDVADGLGGHHERERALVIMKDSRIGSYGALALILSIGLRIGLTAEIAGRSHEAAALAVLAAAAASRGAMGWLWASLPSADIGGLADRVGQPSRRTGGLGLGLGAAILAVLGYAAAAALGVVLPILFGGIATFLFRAFVKRRLGGQTGDCLGACQQLCEIAILLGLAVALA